MDILNTIIELMEKEELRNYKLMAQRSHPGDRKDINLLDYIRKSGNKFRERAILKKLYPGKEKNSYYRLKNRLLEDIGKSLVLLHWDKSEINSALHFLVLGILYREKQHFKVAHHFISKAEKIAQGIGKPELLDLIYGELILLSFELNDINPETYIRQRTENLQTLNRLRDIDNILAAISYRIKVSQNFGAQDSSILELLQKTVNEYSNDPELNRNPQFRFRVYNAVSKIVLQSRDYSTLENYLLNTYQEFNADHLFNRNNHDIKLQMLTYLINAMYKNNHFRESLEWSDKLLEAMKEYNRIHYEKYLFFFFNSRAFNYAEIDPERAIKILEEMLENETITKIPQQVIYIHLNLALFQYNLGRLKHAIKSLVRLMLLESFRNTDPSLKLRITLFELALRFELEEMDTLEYRMNQCRNDFSEFLISDIHNKEQDLINLIAAMAKTNNFRKDKTVEKLAKDFIETWEADDTEIFKYNDWLERNLGWIKKS